MTTPLRHLSPLQFVHQPDGSLAIEGAPQLTVEGVEGQGTVVGVDWQGELGLPQFFEDWELLARADRLGTHHLRFILMDESPTRLPGTPRLQPRQILLPATCSLELGHSGFVVGLVHSWQFGGEALRAHLPALIGLTLPEELDGDVLLGTASLFDSPLAEKAWEGIERQIFTHVCPLVFRTGETPPGTGVLLQVALTPGDYPGCAHARLLNTWTSA